MKIYEQTDDLIVREMTENDLRLLRYITYQSRDLCKHYEFFEKYGGKAYREQVDEILTRMNLDWVFEILNT